MMRELRRLAAESGPIANFVEDPPYPLNRETMSGMSLRIDRYWLRWWWARFGVPWGVWGLRTHRDWFDARHISFDFDGRPEDWERYCENRGFEGNAHPVALIVILRHPPQWKALSNIRAAGEHPILFEHRPPAVGYALQGGDFIGADDVGTLGGFLWSAREQAHYAVTCAHVLGNHPPGSATKAYSPSTKSTANRRHIGQIAHSLVPSAGGGKCNRRIQPGAPEVDFGLVEIDSSVALDAHHPSAGKITRVADLGDLGQDDFVEFHGFKSGAVQARIKECNIWKEIDINNMPVCFSDLFVIEDRSYNYVNSALAQAGDSGAWIVHSSDGLVSWDGMLIGGSGQDVYVCYAEHVLAKASAAIGALTLPP